MFKIGPEMLKIRQMGPKISTKVCKLLLRTKTTGLHLLGSSCPAADTVCTSVGGTWKDLVGLERTCKDLKEPVRTWKDLKEY